MKGNFTIKFTVDEFVLRGEGAPEINVKDLNFEVSHELEIEPENYGKFLETVPQLFMQIWGQLNIPSVRPDHEQRL